MISPLPTETDTSAITVKLFDPVGAIFVMIWIFGFIAISVVILATSQDSTGQLWKTWFLLALMLFAAGLGIYNIITGPRTLIIKGDRLEIVYPKHTFRACSGELKNIRVLRRTKKGKEKVTVFFVDLFEKRRALSFTLSKSGASEAVAWFERLANNKNNSHA